MNNHDYTTSEQHRRGLEALREAPQSTFDLIRECNAVRQGARITELRQRGYVIDTVRMATVDDYGRKHRGIALYVLQPEAKQCA